MFKFNKFKIQTYFTKYLEKVIPGSSGEGFNPLAWFFDILYWCNFPKERQVFL